MSRTDFAKQFLKGKIAELVFDQMFRESTKFTVIPFGYESVLPELQQYTHGNQGGLLETIRNAPDFAIVSHEPTNVYLVEVKYRSRMDLEDTKKSASFIHERWKFAHVFYATPEGFYFDKCTDLMVDGSKVTPLSGDMISVDLQEKYLELLREFITK